MGMGAEPSHGLGLSGDALAAHVVQALGLDEGEGDVAVQEGVVGQVDPLLAALAQEPLHLIAAVREGGGLRRRAPEQEAQCFAHLLPLEWRSRGPVRR